MKGYVNSIQSLGTLDGPGIRFVVFMQGCCLSCGCCHNPETQPLGGGKIYSAVEIADKAERYREYFKADGGITLSGGEPLLQAEFAKELFSICRKRNINTCLDTSGSIMNSEVEELLSYTDRVLLDIKYTRDEDYIKYAGCSIEKPLEFLFYLNTKKIPVTIRQVIIPGLNNTEENIRALSDIADSFPNVDKTELLPFKKLCGVKYEKLGRDFEFDRYDEPTAEEMTRLEKLMSHMRQI